ncbi:hypothetical protein BSKO_05578 [Bryopsis sp. KO-2023]|nr:hypothetical protein BSKO_05578 [Bryopsis sp. KO-2023]
MPKEREKERFRDRGDRDVRDVRDFDRGRDRDRDRPRDKKRIRSRSPGMRDARRRDVRERSRSRERPRRSRSPRKERKRSRDRRHRGRRSRSGERRKRRRGEKESTEEKGDEAEEPKVDFTADITPEDVQMMQAMGIPFGFDSSKGKDSKDLASKMSSVRTKSTRQARQYMNRKGGFNRPLPAERTNEKVIRD